MSIDPELAALCTETLLVESFSSEDAFGEKSYGSAVARSCRIREKMMLVRSASGEERVSRYQILLAGHFRVSVKDRFTLPARFDDGSGDLVARQPEAIAVSDASDESGRHHQRVFF